MRTIVGFFVFNIYLITYYSGILYQVLFAVYLFRQFTKEFSGVSRNKIKDKLTGQVATEFVFSMVVLFWTLPMFVFQHQSLYESGITRQKDPMIYFVFFDYHAAFVIVFFSCWFVWMTVRIQSQHARFQLGSLLYTCLTTLATTACAPLLGVIAKYGRFWYFFP